MRIPLATNILSGLICLFPQIECLKMSHVYLKKDMIRSIDGFEYLSNASFIIKYLSTNIDQNWYTKPELSIYGVRRLTNGSFTCRFYNSSTNISTYEIHLWIGTQV